MYEYISFASAIVIVVVIVVIESGDDDDDDDDSGCDVGSNTVLSSFISVTKFN